MSNMKGRQTLPGAGRTCYGGIPGVKRQRYDGPRMRCTQQTFSGMALAGRLMHACRGKLGDELEGRLRAVPGAWQKWRSGTALLAQAMDAVYATVPDDQFERLWAIFTRGRIDINMPRASDYGGDLVVVHGVALMALAEAAMHNECAICLKEDGHVRKCMLRVALDGVMEPDSQETSGCVWRDQALRDARK